MGKKSRNGSKKSRMRPNKKGISPTALIRYLRYDRKDEVVTESEICTFFGCTPHALEKAVTKCGHRLHMGSQRTFEGLPKGSTQPWSANLVRLSRSPSPIRPSRFEGLPRGSAQPWSADLVRLSRSPSPIRPSRACPSPTRPSQAPQYLSPKQPHGPPPERIVKEFDTLRRTGNIYMTNMCYM